MKRVQTSNRLMPLLLALIMMLSVLPITALADEAPATYDVTFNIIDTSSQGITDATVNVRDSAGILMETASGNYSLPVGNYTYTVSKWGYIIASNTFTVSADATQQVTLSEATPYEIIFNVTPETAVVTLTCETYGTIESESDGSYKLQNGTYTYTISATGYVPATGSITVNGEGQSIYENLDITDEALSDLLENIASKYYQDVTSYWHIAAIQAYEKYNPSTAYKYTDALKQQYVNNAISKIEAGSASDAMLAYNIIALKSLGIDASNLVSLNKQPFSAVTLLQNAPSTCSNGDAYRLLAYQQNGSYANTNQIQAAITSLLGYQDATSGYFTASGYEDADTTAIAVAALAAYYPVSDESDTYGVKSAVDKALTYLKSVQGENGGIASWGTENANSTAMTMIAFASMGIDPASVTNSTTSANLIDGLLQFRTSGNDGFVWSTSYAGDGSQTYQSFLGLIAAKTATNENTFNVFDFSSYASAQGVAMASGETGDNDTGSDYTIPSLVGEEPITVIFTLQDAAVAFSNYSLTVNAGSTVKDVFKQVMSEKGISYTLSGGNYVSMIAGLSEFDGGINAGWMYTVNGQHPEVGIAGKTLSNGDIIIFHFSGDYTQEEDPEKWSGPYTPLPIIRSSNPTEPVVTGTLDKETGVAKSTLSSDELTEFNKAIAANDAKGLLAVITVANPDGATAIKLTLPQSAVTALSKTNNTSLTIETGFGTLTFNPEAIDAISDSSGDRDVTVSIAHVDTNKLSEETRNLIDNRPVYDFSLTVGEGDTLISSFGGGSVGISIPYSLQIGEDENAVVVYYIDDSGKLQTVRGAFNKDKGTVDFTVSHFSQYAIGYNKVTFTDIADTAWYNKAVIYASARNITTGIGNHLFGPEETLTRGQFIVMLLRAYGIERDENPSDNFTDAGATYYTNYLAAAKRLGISLGVGNNKFAPDNEISRQDMCTLLYRALHVLCELPAKTTDNNLLNYTDANQVSDYAETAMRTFVAGGIIKGSEGKLNPSGTSTRAQMVQVLYNLLSKQAE